MKRIVLITIIGLVLACSVGVGGAVVLSQSSAVSIGMLPVYPGAQNVKRYSAASSRTGVTISGSGTLGSAQGQNGSTPDGWRLQFETTDTAQMVFDYYSGWLTANGWRSASGHGPNFYKDPPPDLSTMRFRGFQGIVPKLEIESHYIYHVFVDAQPANMWQKTSVFITLDHEGLYEYDPQ